MLPATRRTSLIAAILVVGLAVPGAQAQSRDPAQEAQRAERDFRDLETEVWDDLFSCRSSEAGARLKQMVAPLDRLRIEYERAAAAGAFSTIDVAQARNRYEMARSSFEVLRDAVTRGPCRPAKTQQSTTTPPPASTPPRATAMPPGKAKVTTLARDLMRVAGTWDGANWGTVVIRTTGEGIFEGTYTSTFGRGLGRFNFSRNGPDSYGGTWYDPDNEHGGVFTLRDLPGNPPRLSVEWKSTDRQPRGGTSTWTREQR